jgi:hypothetical protein
MVGSWGNGGAATTDLFATNWGDTKENLTMKRKMIATILMMTVIAGGTAMGAPSRDSLDRPGNDPRGCRPEPGDMPAPPPPEALLCRMICQLSLSAEQQTRVRAILVKEHENQVSLMKKLAESRKQLRAAEEKQSYDEAAFRNIAMGKALAEVELDVSRARTRSRINALLTPEQQAKAERLPGGHGPAPRFADGQGPCHMPPPPCNESWGQRPDTGSEGKQ